MNKPTGDRKMVGKSNPIGQRIEMEEVVVTRLGDLLKDFHGRAGELV
jgi:hypothetical protein